MPLQPPNTSKLRLAAPPEDFTDGLDELLGPPQTRPGELHDRYPHRVPSAFLHATRSRGIAISLAVSVVCERQLAIGDLAACAVDAVGHLDSAARRRAPTVALSRPFSDYVRTLVAAISGAPERDPAAGPPVVSMRLSSRLLTTDAVVRLDGDDIEIALWWELAATLSGATMIEWALREALQDPMLYGSPTAGQAADASSTAR